MADKEATVYIIDLGSTMGDCHGGRVESDLDWGMRYVWDKICNTVAASRKTWTVGVVGLRTDETENSMQEDDGYDNISILQPVGPMSSSSLRALQLQIKPSNSLNGDAISAIVIATDMIDKAAPKRLKFNRKIILVTDGQGPIDSDDFEDVSQQINDLGIQLVVVGVDFDDADYGFKEEDKDSLKARNERLLQSLVNKCENGVFGTMAQAVAELENPRIKSTRPYKTYDGPLTLGDPKNYESALTFNVERYFMTKIARPPAASTVVTRSGHIGGTFDSTQTLDGMEGVEMAEGDYNTVRHDRTYKVDDSTVPGGKKDVEFQDLAKGYEYGRTAVHISESEYNITKLETTKGFSILGFIPNDKYEPIQNMGESCVIVARKFSEKDELALSALIHALYETASFAVARFVAKDDKEPQLLLLMPSIEPDFECLYDIPLPFAEDVRSYQFPPLDKVVTITGNVLTKHRLLPNDELNKSMSDYVDAMDISEYGIDEDGNRVEYATFEDSYSPMIHRVNQAIRFRALHPDDPFKPATGGVISRFDHPPSDLVEKSKSEIDALIKAADVKKVPPKAKGKRGREQVQPISGLDVDALLSQSKSKRTKISAENSVPEFKQAVQKAEDEAEVQELAKQMGKIVHNLISTSTGDINYYRAVENMRVMREELIELEFPGLYNTFAKDLKQKLATNALNGNRLEMWWKIKKGGLGLITRGESDPSDVSGDAAEEFIRHIQPAT